MARSRRWRKVSSSAPLNPLSRLSSSSPTVAAAAEIAAGVCPRLGFDEAETEMVVWLVRHHLLMSDVAQKRDTSDPRTVRDFANIVQSPTRLRLLLVLTVCDIRGVGPGVWNNWKAQLLRKLYWDTRDLLTGGSDEARRAARVEEARAALADRLAD